MNYEWVPWLIGALQLIFTVVFAVLAMRWRKERASKKELEDLGVQIQAVDTKHTKTTSTIIERLSHIEGSLEHLPTAKQINDLSGELAKTSGDVSAVGARLDSQAELLKNIAANVTMLTENELAQGRQHQAKG
ncbi:DUF2730 family protein [Kiloniella litopenaei]|uniref:DUF2730 family protein n=1 Tax=Kiloniella litopenaei TaxID=1549748 RepID=UPI003BAA0891